MMLQAWHRDLVRDINNLLDLFSMSLVHPILLGGHRATRGLDSDFNANTVTLSGPRIIIGFPMALFYFSKIYLTH